MSRRDSPSIPPDAGNSEPLATSTLELLNLPDLSIQAIIAHIPLQTLITTIPLVHPRLLPFREAALLANHHLELFIGNQQAIQENISVSPFRLPYSRYLVDSLGQPLYPETSFHRLRLATLESPTVDQLTRLMPAISHLTLRLSQVDILTILEVIRLLKFWASTLTSFTFSCSFTDDSGVDSRSNWERDRDKDIFGYLLHRLLDSINTDLLSLEVLSLQMHELLFDFPLRRLALADTEPTLAMPILGRLKKFYFKSDDLYQDFIINSLRDYATPDKDCCSLQAIGIAMLHDWEVYLEAFPAGSPLASCFVTLPYIFASTSLSRAVQLASIWLHEDPKGKKLYEESIEEEGLSDVIWASPSPAERYLQLQERLLGAFSNLRVVNIEVDATRPFNAVLRPLSRLSQLQVLKLKIDDSPGLDSGLLPRDYPALPGVLALHLELHPIFDNAQHTDLLSPLWGTIFPSVQVIMLEHNLCHQFCTLCYPNAELEFLRDLGNAQYEEVMPCLKQLVAPLTVLPSLRKLFYKKNYVRYKALEFSPSGDFIQTHTQVIY